MNDFLKEEVFQTFIEVNRPLWMRLAVRVLENREEAEDVVQETLAGLWEKRNSLEVVNPGAYVARSIWLNSLKRRTRRKIHLPLEDVREPEAAQESELFDEAMASRLPQLEKALKRLPEEQQKVLRMKYQMDLSFKEIGETLQISLHTAASRTRYALKTLRKIFNVR
ncbi:MAG TPA: sigma-70 family RNA polymerase sigma factor [bacterium]|nr:sigma-70 family RNA polymerase sigma factor [bacterium]